MQTRLITALLATTMMVGTAAAQMNETKEAPGSNPSTQQIQDTPKGPNATAPRNVGPTSPGQAQGQSKGAGQQQAQPSSQAQSQPQDTKAETPAARVRDNEKSQDRKRATQPGPARDGDAREQRAKDERGPSRSRAEDLNRDRDNDRVRADGRDRDNVRDRSKDDPRDRAEDRRDRDGRSEDRAEGRDRDRQSVSISNRQETSIRQAFARENVRRTTNVNFNISVGATIPRSVTLYPVPSSIVQIVPQYRGYRYIAVEDEIIIVHPQTYRIVTIISMDGGRQARRGSSRVEFSSAQRQRIRSFALQECRTIVAAPTFDLTVGALVPETYELCPFDEVVVRDVQVVRPYRYMIVQDEVVLVDPSTQRIVEVIR
jgi:hypothetical protein